MLPGSTEASTGPAGRKLTISQELLGIERCFKCTQVSSFKGLQLVQQDCSSNLPPKTRKLVLTCSLFCIVTALTFSPPMHVRPQEKITLDPTKKKNEQTKSILKLRHLCKSINLFVFNSSNTIDSHGMVFSNLLCVSFRRRSNASISSCPKCSCPDWHSTVISSSSYQIVPGNYFHLQTDPRW